MNIYGLDIDIATHEFKCVYPSDLTNKESKEKYAGWKIVCIISGPRLFLVRKIETDHPYRH